MPVWKSLHYKVEMRVGPVDVPLVQLRPGGTEPQEVIVHPLSGTRKPVRLFCVRASGTAAGFDPPPRDAWDHDFGRIDLSTPIPLRTVARTVLAEPTPGAATLRVNELHDHDGLGPRQFAVHLDVDVIVR